MGKQRVEEKSKRELEQSEHQRRKFEEAVKNVEAGVSVLEHTKVLELEKKEEQNKSVEVQPNPTKKQNKTKSVPNEIKSLRNELKFPTVEAAEEEASTKPSVQESLNKIKLRNEMKKKMSLESLKSKKGMQAKESRSNSHQPETKAKKKTLPEKHGTSLSVQPEKKGKVKLRGKKKKAAKEEEESESVKDSADSFDYNQVMPIEVVAGTVNYFAPLLLKKEKKADVSNGKPSNSQDKQTVKPGIADGKGKKSKKAEYLERNSHRFIKGDYQLMAFAQDYLHIKDCEEAESKFRRLNS